jgi:hypothetical protein
VSPKDDALAIEVSARILREAFRGIDPHPLDAVTLASLSLQRLDPVLLARIQSEKVESARAEVS